MKEDFNVKPLTFEKSVAHFESSSTNRHRERAIARMTADPEDGGPTGSWRAFLQWLTGKSKLPKTTAEDDKTLSHRAHRHE